MAIQVVAWILECSEATMGDRLVLLSLANHARADGTGAWPSRRQIATEARLSERQVQRCIQNLERDGRITVQRGEGPHGTNMCTVMMSEPSRSAGGDNMSPDGGETDRLGETSTTQGGDTGVSRTVLEPPNSEIQEPNSQLLEDSSSNVSDQLALVDAREGPSSFEDFWEIYPRKVGKRAASAAWVRACRRSLPPTIIAGARRYRDDPNRQPTFTAHPTTWLNQDRWADDPLPARPPPHRSRQQETDEIFDQAARRMGVIE